MEWDAKTHLQWDWENLTSFDGKESEIPEQLRSSAAAERGVVDRPIYSPGVGVCPSSDWGNGSSSRSSFSASMDSIPKAGGGRAVVINFEAVEGFPRDLAKKKELARAEDTGASPELVASFGSGSGELLIGLKLGKRTYFEDVCAGGNIRASFSSTPSLSTTTLVKKCRASHQSMQSSRCQVEGCNLDLTTAKNYHRKHRVCESHSKCAKVVVAGRERRFCQQCSRFHDLSEFDQNKRSCRRRLSNHNARRRKPALDTISFNCAKLSSAFYDDGQQMNLMLSSAPFGHVNPATSSIWESSRDFKFGQGKGSWISSTKAGGTVGPQHLPSNYLSTATCTFRHSMDGLLPFKGTTAEIFNQGPEASASASNLDGAPDLRRALSLLSTDSWGSADTGTTSLDQLVHVNHTTGAAQHAINVVHPSSDCWQAEQQPYAHETQVVPFILHSHGRLFQEFQPLKMPYETALIDSKKIH